MPNKDSQLLSALTGLGLSEHEAQVYLAILSFGSATVLQISRASGLKRTTIYYILESLKNQGFISVEVRGLKQQYVAEHPERLARLISRKQKEFQDLLPEFSALYTLHGTESAIKYYQGLEAIKSVYESMLQDIRPKEDYMVTADAQQWLQLDPEYFKDFRSKRAKLNIRRRLLLQDNATGREFMKFAKNYGEEIKLLPPKTALTTNLVVIPRRLLIHQLTSPVTAIVIENRSVIQTHQQVFELLWQSMNEQKDKR